MSGPLRRALWLAALALALALPSSAGARPAGAQTRASTPSSLEELEEKGLEIARDVEAEIGAAAVRLPLAAALGAVLAWRPRRRGSPPRRASVVETQVVLAVIGALIMLVVGASLARAFGIVGVASLIRYRSKINDPRDAVVMLSALAVGLACGTGRFALAAFATLFLLAVLFLVEGFERSTRAFELTLKLGARAAELRPSIEQVLRRVGIDYELRATSDDELSYLVTVPSEVSTNRVSKSLAALVRDGKGAVEWSEKTKNQMG